MNSRLIILAFFLCSVACSFAQKGFKPDTSFYYKNTAQGKLVMDVFIPPNHQVTDKSPVIIFFFGGGWVSGLPDQFYQQARYFSENGMVAISADYRTFNKHKTTPFECVSDAKSAIRWVRQHAGELGINTQKIIASGGSAGGHIAACSGILEGYESEGENLTISSVPNAMILFNPVIDTGEKGYGIAKVGLEHKADISPVAHIKPGIPPTIIFHGTADKTVPFENVERFTRLMKEAGNTCELKSFPGKDHGFFNGSFFRPKQSDEDFNATMKAAMVFLTKLHLDK
jgi:acetyl esterase